MCHLVGGPHGPGRHWGLLGVVLPAVTAVPIRRHVHLPLQLLIGPLVQLRWRRGIWAGPAMLLVADPGHLLAVSLQGAASACPRVRPCSSTAMLGNAFTPQGRGVGRRAWVGAVSVGGGVDGVGDRVSSFGPLGQGGPENVSVYNTVDALSTSGADHLVLLLGVWRLLLLGRWRQLLGLRLGLEVVVMGLHPVWSLFRLPVRMLLLLRLLLLLLLLFSVPVTLVPTSTCLFHGLVLGTSPSPATPHPLAVRVSKLERPTGFVPQVSNRWHKCGPGDFRVSPAIGRSPLMWRGIGQGCRRRWAEEVWMVVGVVGVMWVMRVAGVELEAVEASWVGVGVAVSVCVCVCVGVWVGTPSCRAHV